SEAPTRATGTFNSKNAPEQRKLDAQRRQQQADKARPIKRELEGCEKRMAELTQEKTRLEAQLAKPLAPAAIADAGKRLKSASDELHALEERWLELTEQIEHTASA
ncbi:MAG TPA: ABC transporter C-terminal domain-containing protein, partial [Rhodoferax sp.]|nr:ABC transporter C-terminal domain-containing protein [Rhodoferax sp.]